jgi:hypothetical protein
MFVRKTTIKQIAFLLLMLLGSCTLFKNPTEPEKKDYYFAIFKVKGSLQDAHDKELTLEDLESKPWISDEDIEFYDWFRL